MRQAGVSNNSTVAAVLAKDLAGFGARRCFGLLGTANFKISHALVEAGVELISARHEGNAASMADAYAKATGELTLVSVHSGPGLTNAITGIGEAAKSRTPLLVLAGDVPTGNVKSNFYMNQTELVRSVGAVSERIYTPRSARGDLLRAVTCAMHDRQTVVLSLPLDVQDAKIDATNAPLELGPVPGRLQPNPEDIRTLADAIVRAKRPLVPKDRVVASDSGHFCGWVPRYLRVHSPKASCLSHSFQSVGLGLASVIGLAVANPGKLAVLGAGDGGFLMSIADLETAIRLGLRMCILIYNDSSYAAEVHFFRRQGYSIDIVQFPETDFATIARGYGARASTVRSTADLEPVRAWVNEGAAGVFVIDAKINPDLEADWHAEHFP